MATSAAGIAAIKNSKIISVVVKPGSGENEIVGYSTTFLGKRLIKKWHINVKTAAEKDEANKELLKFLRKETGKTWLIKKGLHSREKTLVSTSS